MIGFELGQQLDTLPDLYYATSQAWYYRYEEAKKKKISENTFNRKSNGNLISQLKILTQNRAVFETSSTNMSVPKIAYQHPPTLFLKRTDLLGQRA